jgi:hypothetical protein
MSLTIRLWKLELSVMVVEIETIVKRATVDETTTSVAVTPVFTATTITVNVNVVIKAMPDSSLTTATMTHSALVPEMTRVSEFRSSFRLLCDRRLILPEYDTKEKKCVCKVSPTPLSGIA